MPHPHLAIARGDPARIGPEIIIKAGERPRSRIKANDLRLLIIGRGSARAADYDGQISASSRPTMRASRSAGRAIGPTAAVRLKRVEQATAQPKRSASAVS